MFKSTNWYCQQPLTPDFSNYLIRGKTFKSNEEVIDLNEYFQLLDYSAYKNGVFALEHRCQTFMKFHPNLPPSCTLLNLTVPHLQVLSSMYLFILQVRYEPCSIPYGVCLHVILSMSCIFRYLLLSNYFSTLNGVKGGFYIFLN